MSRLFILGFRLRLLAPGIRCNRLPATRRFYKAERHSSLAPETWIITGREAKAELPAVSLAMALGTPHVIRPAQRSWMASNLLTRSFIGLKNVLSSAPTGGLNFVKNTTGEIMPRFAIAASKDALPGLLEIKQRAMGRTIAIYLGLPATKLSNIDVLVLSRLDQMKLRRVGPARANLENSVSTLLPLSGAKAASQPFALEPAVVVCIGKGVEPAGYQMLKSDIEMLAQQLQHIPRSRIRIVLPFGLHRKLRVIIEQRLISQLQQRSVDLCGEEHLPSDVEIVDYALGNQPPLSDVLASASHVIVTADDISSVSLAVSLRRPVYIAGEERTTGLLRDYYHLLDSGNLVRRFYPKGSRYSYMVAADITGKVDEFSAIRDHEPWAPYDARHDLDHVAAFIRKTYDESNS
ncbi:hypothetical protein H4R20_001077 [Coemansia guatemalensis]|uniref:Uncharacterized protein n=1 Tax=Coemansia guatemalensis TaxID=2761395 RepID=A0A9W8I527_9FUNG|nr:hypothetical protein H4R20_001077 [Coemansia guatemalensis]